jgi:hypothetical protein
MPDTDPARWQRMSIAVEDKAVGFAIPKHHRFEDFDPRHRKQDLSADSTELFDAWYEYGQGVNDIPEFGILVILRRYAQLDPELREAMRKLRPDMVDTPPPGLPLRSVGSAKLITLAGHSWVQLTGTKGKTSYSVPFSNTHALLIVVSFFSKAPHDEAWFEARRELLLNVARTVTITDSSGESTLPTIPKPE